LSESRGPAADLSGVAKRFGGIVALDGLDLELSEGEVPGLIGPSGSGKTSAAVLPELAVLAAFGLAVRALAVRGLGRYRKG
jgi:ABC-type Fe3+/spermidine/putrescine transport system ATPase subunit